ncbi:MAG: hypothetical protein AABY26_02940 [Nanoarchaeota archaeon]
MEFYTYERYGQDECGEDIGGTYLSIESKHGSRAKIGPLEEIVKNVAMVAGAVIIMASTIFGPLIYHHYFK